MPDSSTISPGFVSPSRTGVALVTGATGIIGPAICQALRDAGYLVAAHARDPVKAQRMVRIREKITRIPFPASQFFYADLSDPAVAPALIQEIEGSLGPIGLLVNNAVTNALSVPLGQCTTEYAQQMLNVNLVTPIQLVRASLNSLKQTQGSVINISSVAVRWMWEGSMMYGVSKAALEQATRAMAIELGQLEVRANTIRLGSVPSDVALHEVLERLPEALAPRFYEDMMALRRRFPAGRQALGHGGTPEDVASLITFLASPQARFLTGATIALDGGMDLVMEPTPVKPSKLLSEHIQEWLETHAPDLALG